MGKIIGAILGYWLAGPFGVLIGFFIGSRFDKAKSIYKRKTTGFGGFQRNASPEQQTEFFEAAFSVMGHIAKVKGQITESDIQFALTMMQRMNLQGESKRIAQQAYEKGKSADFPLREVLRRVNDVSRGRQDIKQFFLELQISSTFSDGQIHPSERAVLHIITEVLGFSIAQLESRLRMQEAAFRFHQNGGFNGQQGNGGNYQQASTQDQISAAYEILDIDSATDTKTIKRAYRKLMNEHHPDKLASKGLPPEMLQIAKEKTQEIQNAYEVIKKDRNFK